MTATPRSGWVPSPQPGAVDERGVREIQELTRRLLGELDRAARDAGVPYLLAYGTALGARRDGDLIPWDVDADVWVRQCDYAALLSEVAPRLGPDVELLAPETHDDYEYLFPRLALRGVHHVFVRVDVFPLDPAPRSRLSQVAYLRLARFLARWFYAKRVDGATRVHYTWRFLTVLRLVRVLTAPVPSGAVLRAFRRLQRSYAGRGTGVLVNSCGSYGEREFFAERWFDTDRSALLGGESRPVPGELDVLLEHLYGDWRALPSERQRRFELEAATDRLVRPMREAGLLPEAGRAQR